MNREDILSKRAINFFTCKEFVKLGIIEREKFESIHSNERYFKAYRPFDAPELIRDAAIVGYDCWRKAIEPTIFYRVEQVMKDVSYACVNRFPILSNEPMEDWAEDYYNEVMK